MAQTGKWAVMAKTLMLAAGNKKLAAQPGDALISVRVELVKAVRQAPGEQCRTHKPGSAGFTLIELLVVIAIVAVATAGVGLAMRGTAQSSLEREAQRLAVLFESARAQSRASGVAVVWRTTPEGFKFEGLPAGVLPERWLSEGITADGSTLQLGPEPIIGPQAVELMAAPVSEKAPQTLRIATDGLRPFAVGVQGQP